MKAHITTPSALPRKIFRRTVKVALENSWLLDGKTMDISTKGMTLMSPAQIARGLICEIAFDVSLDGKIRKVNAVTKSLDSVCIGTQGFRTGLRFLDIDDTSRKIINELVG